MRKVSLLLLAVMALMSLGLAGCGSSSSEASKTATLSGALEAGANKITLKTAEAAAGSIGTVTAIDAATGNVISAPANAAINADGTFSIKISPPATQAGVVLKAAITATAKSYRLLVTDTLTVGGTVSGKLVGPNSDVIVTKVSEALAHGGILGDGGTLHSGIALDAVKNEITNQQNKVLPYLAVGYVIDTGVDAAKPASVSIFDRATNTLKKTVRFTTGIKTSGHFANVNADGSELWLCTNDPNNGVGTVNVIKTAAFNQYSTINSGNKDEFIIKSFNVGCGIQSTQSPDGKYLFTSSNQETQGINVFDVTNRRYLGNIPNDNTAPHVGAVSPDNKVYYTTTAGKYHAVGYDITSLAARSESATAAASRTSLDLPRVLDVDFGYDNLHALRLHPSGKYLFVGSSGYSAVPSGKPNTSGTNVIDIAAKKIVARVDSRPHNFAISPDARYLSVTDNSTGDCHYEHDDGYLVQFIDISTLLTATPDFSKIKTLYQFRRDGLKGSHAAWDATTGLFYYSVEDAAGQGWLYALNTSKLASNPASVDVVADKVKVGYRPHGISFAGINGD